MAISQDTLVSETSTDKDQDRDIPWKEAQVSPIYPPLFPLARDLILNILVWEKTTYMITINNPSGANGRQGRMRWEGSKGKRLQNTEQQQTNGRTYGQAGKRIAET
jgi:hypothetical protein